LPEATPLYASYLSAGEIYYRDGDYKQSVSYLEQARDEIEEAAPENMLRAYRIHYGLGQSYLGLNEPEKAGKRISVTGKDRTGIIYRNRISTSETLMPLINFTGKRKTAIWPY